MRGTISIREQIDNPQKKTKQVHTQRVIILIWYYIHTQNYKIPPKFKKTIKRTQQKQPKKETNKINRQIYKTRMPYITIHYVYNNYYVHISIVYQDL